MTIENAIASLAVQDLERSVSWYESLFERPADSRPMEGVAEWRFPRGGWLQVYALPERSGRGSVTLAVSDIEEVAARVASLDIDPPERTSTEAVDTLMIRDPDGNSIAFAEAHDPSMAR